VINNLESWPRSGRWHDPTNREEGAFLLMLASGYSASGPARTTSTPYPMQRSSSFGLLACSHYSWLVHGLMQRCSTDNEKIGVPASPGPDHTLLCSLMLISGSRRFSA